MSGRIYSGSLVALSLLIASEVAWTTFLVVAAVWLLVLVAWALSSRAEAWKVARDAQATAAEAVTQAETFADEQKATHAANEILCAELADSDAKIRRLSRDLLAAQTRLSDYENGAEVIAFPSQRDPQHDSLAALDAEATEYTWPAIAREAFPIQQWGEEAEK